MCEQMACWHLPISDDMACLISKYKYVIYSHAYVMMSKGDGALQTG